MLVLLVGGFEARQTMYNIPIRRQGYRANVLVRTRIVEPRYGPVAEACQVSRLSAHRGLESHSRNGVVGSTS
jgi:hypothetical protein